MKRTIILSAIAAVGLAMVAACSSPAAAADVPMKPSYRTVAVYDWNGTYIGVHGGWNRTEADAPGVVSFSTNNYHLGGQVGFNRQIGSLVWGLEADASWNNLDENVALFGGAANANLKSNLFGTARARLGLAYDNWLFYGTAGVGVMDSEVTLSVPGFSRSDQNYHVGWVAGAGIEWGIWRNTSLKLEYLYGDFGTQRYAWPIAGPIGISQDVKLEQQIVRAGINVRF